MKKLKNYLDSSSRLVYKIDEVQMMVADYVKKEVLYTKQLTKLLFSLQGQKLLGLGAELFSIPNVERGRLNV